MMPWQCMCVITGLVIHTACKPGEYMCNNESCVEATQKCDGIRHCKDGEDELGCQSWWLSLCQAC